MLIIPSLFDDITDEQLGAISMDAQELVSTINALREKSAFGGGLTDDEVRLGISTIVELRKIRSKGKGQNELPPVLQQNLADIF